MNRLDDFEPLKYYTGQLKAQFEKNAEQYFDELVKRSGINAGENAATVAKYDAARARAEAAGQKLSSGKALRGFVIFIAIAAIIAAVILLFIFFVGDVGWPMIVCAILCAVLGAATMILAKTKLKKIVDARQERHSAALAEAERIKQQALEQMSPLNALFRWNMARELLLKTLPDMTIDDRLDVKKLDLFINKYGFRRSNTDADSSSVFLLSGTYDGNPYLFERLFRHTTISKTYTGSLVIHWVTHSTDSKGRSRTHHHSQTLIASIERPAPMYAYDTRLYYGNEAAPALNFSRTAKHTHKLDEDDIEHTVKKGAKKLAKMSREAIESNSGGFTEIGNTEFEVLFGATDRDNEVEFRLMFTPLAQNNMLDLLKSDEGYGDDFAFYKRGLMNCIRSEHAQSWQPDANPARYMSHDLKASRQAFISYNTNYFKSVYFDFAPLLSIPLYRMQKPAEYIYRDVYPSNYTEYEAEATANTFDRARFAPKGAKTESILKAAFIERDGAADRMMITAHSFDTVEHIEYVEKLGGDGNIHLVPVPWTEYIPISRTSEMEIMASGGTRDDYERTSGNSAFAQFVRRFSHDGASAYCDGLVGIPLTKGDFKGADSAELGKIFGLREAAAGTAAFIAGIEAVKAAAALDRAETAAAGQQNEETDGGSEGQAPEDCDDKN